MITALYRIIKYGLKNFWRQRLISLATLTIILLAIFVLQSLLVFNAVADRLLTSIEDKIDISVYFNTNAPEDEILSLKKTLEGLSEVKAVSYVSRQEALDTFKKNHENDKDGNIVKAIDQLGDNPLPASLNIKASDPSKYAAIAKSLDCSGNGGIISECSYSENQVVIDKLVSIIDVSKKAGILLTIVLSLVAMVVSFNTILLAIYSNREEIGIMRLVGASNSFIRGPYIVEGVIYGVVATILCVLISLPIAYTMTPYLNLLSSDIGLSTYYVANLMGLIGYELLFGIAIGVISSLVAIRKYIKI